MIKISVLNDFSDKPFGRYKADGKWSGERFREELLLPAFKEPANQKVVVDLSGINRGFGSSFLEEAFGGLVRAGVDKKRIQNDLEIQTDEEDYIIEIMEYIERA